MILVTCKLGLIREFISFPELSVEQQKKSKISFLLNKPHGVFRNYKYQNTLKWILMQPEQMFGSVFI